MPYSQQVITVIPMKRLMMCMLMIFQSSAWADWVPLSKTTNSDEYFYDDSSIQRSGRTARIWVMTNFRDPKKHQDGYVYVSSKEKILYNCDDETRSTLYLMHFSERDGEGEVHKKGHVPQHTIEFRAVPKDSVSAKFMKIACGKK